MKPRSFAFRVSTTIFALCAFASMASAASYTSAPLRHDFCPLGACWMPDDSTFEVFTDQTGWYNFGSNANPLPELMNSIHPAFDSLYQIDSLTFTLHQLLGDHTFFKTWYFDVGDGVHPGGEYASLMLTSGFVQSFTLHPDDDVLKSALTDPDGVLQFRLREGTPFGDVIMAFNASVAVNYSDRQLIVTQQDADPLPEPGTLALFAAAFLGLAAMRHRR